MYRWLAAILLSTLPAAAGLIDVTNLEQATLHHNARLLIEFSVWNYAASNPEAPWPTHVGLTVLGRAPGIAPATLPDSTGEFFPGYVFDGRLESLDGSAWAPFDDPLLLVPGTLSLGGADPLQVAVLAGSIDLTPAAAEQIFGGSLGARFVLQNLGGSFVLGLGNGYTIRNFVWEPDVRGAGPRAVAGLTDRVMINNPEPPGWLLLASGVGLIVTARLGLRYVSARKRSHSPLSAPFSPATAPLASTAPATRRPPAP